MYAKSGFRSNEEVNIPENYRGNAFREISADEAQKEDGAIEVVEEKDRETEKQVDLPIEPQKKLQHQSPLLAAIMPPKVSKPNGLLSNVGLEELLIFGILLLLSQGDSDDDILLLLFLLLFYK